MAEVSVTKSVSSDRISARPIEQGTAVKATASSPIGMYDSGVGGLSVLKEVAKQLPNEDVVYFADTARVPYGSRSPQELVRFNQEIIGFLESLSVKLIIIACGTSSAVAYPIVKEHYKVPLVPLIDPGARAAVASTKNGKIGVIATQATVDSSAYPRAIKKINKDIQVISAACPMFVPLIEGGFLEADETKKVALQYLKPLMKAGIDTLVLGCTHYPHLYKILREITGINVKFVDPAEESVTEAKKILKEKQLLSPKGSLQGKGNYHFLVSGSPVSFADLGSRLMGKPLHNVKQSVLPKAGRKGRQ